MSQSAVNQKYKLSVVSGGKPIIPRSSNVSSSDKSVSCLTSDLLNYIVPFNNQIKIYSVETRQCVKTLKYSNNGTLSTIFNNEEVYATDILLGDVLSTKAEDQEQNKNKNITVFTNNGHIVVLNYNGKLSETLFNTKLEIGEDETIFKVFQYENDFKILTTMQSETNASLFTYKLYTFRQSQSNSELELQETIENVILSTWSQNDKYLALLNESDNKKQFNIQSLFDDSVKNTFLQSSIVSSNTNNASANARYVSSMALDNNCSQLALGFASGVINVVSITDLQGRLLKWHIDSVLSLCFTQDGSYLLSGGWEKVVSFWQLSTNMQQFLPRLNGVMIDCQSLGNDKYYALALQMTENNSNSDFQLLLLNSADLNSRLSINGPLPVFNSTVKNTIQPLSAVATRSSTTVHNAILSKKKLKKKLLKSKKQDYTACVEINPVSKQLFFPHMSAMQVYDFYRNEQVSYQYLAFGVNNSMGKVRFELNIKDPIIVNIKFTKNGKWMITYEVEFPPDELLSSKDLVHNLKFWTKDDSESDWTLMTKVLNPHGPNSPITKILPSPISINNSEGCITADNNGGLKYWSFEEHEKNWCLTKLSLPNFNHFSNSVSLAWSQDGSLIFHGFDDKLTILDFDTFKKFEPKGSEETISEFTLDSEIQTIKIVKDSSLIIATHTTLCCLDLLKGRIVNSFDIYPYVKGIYRNGHLDRLISCDERTGKIALVINQQLKNEENNDSAMYKARILVFNSDLSEKMGSFVHNEYISWIGWNYDTDFIFLDTECKLGIVGTTVNTEMLDEVNSDGLLDGLANTNDFVDQLKKLTSSKDSNVDQEDEEDIALEFINGNKSDKTINMNSFTSMFENIQNVQMDTLFDRVMRVIT